MGTFSQSIYELMGELVGQDWTYSQVLTRSRSYLKRTGSPKPSPAMVRQLAEEAWRELNDRERA